MNFDDSGVNILLRVRLHMAGDEVTACIAELLHIPHGTVDHQVDVQRQIRHRADALYHRDADGDIGDEQAVHDVHVDIVGVGDALDVTAQMGEVGGEDGGGDLDHDDCPFCGTAGSAAA